jgi:hypothetical protein
MKKRLADLATIRTGFQFRGRVESDPTGNVRLIQIKDIDDERRIRTDALIPVQVDRPEPYLVQQGDVLFLARGHRQFATVIADPLQDAIATGFFFILTVDPKRVHSAYLTWCINQPEFQEAMRPFVRGSHMPLVSKTDFQELTIPVPPLDVQRRIVALNELLDRERRLTTAIQEKRSALVHALSQKAANRR